MWIITKQAGAINADTATRITENHFGTHIQCGTAMYTISERKILSIIVEALKNDQNFLEVE